MAAGKKARDTSFERQYRTAVRRGKRSQLRAVAARYDPNDERVVVDLDNGALFAFPTALVQGLSGASESDLRDIEIYGAGTALHWDSLDVDFELDALLAGVFGTRAWMRELGRLGGSATSVAKARAARANGARGGRPRKSTNGGQKGT